MIVTSKVKKHMKEVHELRTSEEALFALGEEVTKLLKEAAERAKADKRRTIQARDVSPNFIETGSDGEPSP